jgi:hypothetical protein
MRKVATTFLVLAATLASAAPALAQGGRGGRGMGMMRAPENSVTWLISKKADYNGSDEQIKSLELIARKLDDDTKEVRAQIMKLLPPPPADPQNMTDEERTAIRAKMQEIGPQLRPLREEFQKKDEAAIQEALAIFKDDQCAIVKKLLEDRASAGRSGRRG